MNKFKILSILILFLVLAGISFAKNCPSEEQFELSRFVLTGEVVSVNYNETVAGTDYYIAEIKIEELRKGNLLEKDFKQRVGANPELKELTEKGKVFVKYGNEASFITGEKAKVYLKKDFYSGMLKPNFEECSKITVKNASLINRLLANPVKTSLYTLGVLIIVALAYFFVWKKNQ